MGVNGDTEPDLFTGANSVCVCVCVCVYILQVPQFVWFSSIFLYLNPLKKPCIKSRGVKTFEFEAQGKLNLFCLLGNISMSSVASEGLY